MFVLLIDKDLSFTPVGTWLRTLVKTEVKILFESATSLIWVVLAFTPVAFCAT